jgi:hypothetical protein
MHAWRQGVVVLIPLIWPSLLMALALVDSASLYRLATK